MESALSVLARVFGYAAFRGQQGEVIDRLMAGLDVCAVMPTGAGKSVCYQVPAIARPGTGLVISPLIALMQDQVQALRANGVAAAAIAGDDGAANADATRRLRDGTLDLLYVAPERAVTEGFARLLDGVALSLIAIDEAHCVSQWGHDFRPEYRQLRGLLDRQRGVPRGAFTATADAETRADILGSLGIAPDGLVVAGFDRPNIRYEVKQRAAVARQLTDFLRDRPGESGIIYSPSRARTDEVAASLAAQGVRALPYHAGLQQAVRAQNQHAFTHGEGVVMVATIAFGMGVDKPDVRFVVHLGLPGSVEAYYQETGRAGRDGGPAVAHLLYGAGDVALARQRIDASAAPAERRAADHLRLNALVQYAEASRCRRAILLRYFGEEPPAACGNCDNCLNPPALADMTEEARKFLSAVYRTGQRFGAGHVARVLRGESDERTAKWGHEALSVWGIGRDTSAKAWGGLARQLIAADALRVDEEHKGLALGPAARGILKGEARVEARADLAAPARRERRRDGTAPASALGDDAQARFEQLRAWRRATAAEAGVPPYVIFHDTTLRAIAEHRPATLSALGEIPGIGRAKLDAYGKAVLEVLRQAFSPA